MCTPVTAAEFMATARPPQPAFCAWRSRPTSTLLHARYMMKGGKGGKEAGGNWGEVCRVRVTPRPTGERPARGETTGPRRCTLVGQRMKYIVCVCGRPFLRPTLEV
eukprot:scaffold32905_cov61-Phaeocystis_antarctica.AAC.1